MDYKSHARLEEKFKAAPAGVRRGILDLLPAPKTEEAVDSVLRIKYYAEGDPGLVIPLKRMLRRMLEARPDMVRRESMFLGVAPDRAVVREALERCPLRVTLDVARHINPRIRMQKLGSWIYDIPGFVLEGTGLIEGISGDGKIYVPEKHWKRTVKELRKRYIVAEATKATLSLVGGPRVIRLGAPFEARIKAESPADLVTFDSAKGVTIACRLLAVNM